MKEVKFSQNSWHWRLAGFYGNAEMRYNYETETERYDGDICSYIRSMLYGLFRVVVLTAILGLLAASLGNFGAWVVAGFMTGTFIKIDALGSIIMILTAVVALMVVFFFCISKFENWKQARRKRKHEQLALEKLEEQPESFMRAAYRKFKDKTCFRVEVT